MVNVPLCNEGTMVLKLFPNIAISQTWSAIVLRGGIVACNFAVMIVLAAVLGLAAFGELAVIWGLAMIASTVLSGGAPLQLLRVLTNGQGIALRHSPYLLGGSSRDRLV